MLIALDYDGTYTADPELMLGFVKSAKNRGHEVVCVTMRHPHELDHVCPLLKSEVEVICTARRAKRTHMAMIDRAPAVWVDDNPTWIIYDSL